MSLTEDLVFPPLLRGEVATGDALAHAARRAALGCDAGLVAYVLGPLEVQAALVFAPEVPLREAMTMLPLCGLAFQNALGALGPPEVAVHLEWDGRIRINGASCGALSVVASVNDPEAQPDWLVVGWTVPLMHGAREPGTAPDQTALYEEGCADVTPPALVESWARHTLYWINRWEDSGTQPVHAEWRGLAHGIGEDMAMAGQSGTFLGVDEHFGMLLRDDATTHLIPLTTILKEEVS